MKWEQDLVVDIRKGNSSDDADFNFSSPHPLGYQMGNVEFSQCNRENLASYFGFVKDRALAILEIGVCRNDDQSSTHVFLKNKRPDATYIGIDLDDKSFLDNAEKKIFTIKNSSSDFEANVKKFAELGVTQFDFIFIDGWHSINQVLLDWEYTSLLSDKGMVGFHDVSCHPGPSAFVAALDKSKWRVIQNTCPADWGIAFAWKR